MLLPRTVMSVTMSTVLVISSAPTRPFAGNNAYSVDFTTDETETRWVFQIYADGYTDKDKEGNQIPLDNLMINKESKRLTVLKAMNGLDTTEPRLKMRQVLKECWEQAGLQPSELKEVLGYMIENTNMKEAIADCRTTQGLAESDSFEVTGTDTDANKKTCWDRLGNTIFSSAIRGAIRDFDINKQLISIKVDNGGNWDHVYYGFST
ncbi:hypothetical protein INS49_010560 [Diaporthe citri]|uniref:uncharacterized protein n=1 Tax=Diaporthe citri TaxID=83186 RepID=UPI001C81E1AB|nr:uncharacterized protein INS49_010560 [Diaporthe citri]KAG6362330.1 hypothetical protein INS49_010560 [Diaporthe citri]